MGEQPATCLELPFWVIVFLLTLDLKFAMKETAEDEVGFFSVTGDLAVL